MRDAILLLAPILALSLPSPVCADPISREASARAVDALTSAMDSYVDTEGGRKVAAALRHARDELVAIDDRQALVEAMNAVLQANSSDLHLKTRIDTATAQQAELTPEDEARLERHLAHGLMAVRRLPGNIGLLKLRYFAADADGAALVDAAMAMLSHTDALIIDLRENTGGGGAADTRLLGQLSADPIPMAAIHWRQADGTTQVEQRHADIPEGGPLWPDKPLYVLTAQRTFSAAEAVAYDLQSAKRAVLVGERTRGGANPSNRGVELGSGLSAFIPNGRVVHPTTGGNWEGTGVQPDIPTAPAEALVTAYRLALVAARPVIETPRSRQEHAAALADPRAALMADSGL